MLSSVLRRTSMILLGLLAPACATPGPPPAAPTTEYLHGQWYENGRFVARTVYERGGLFVTRPGRPADRRVDLGGGFVLPAFAEGHHHTIICDAGRIRQFVDAGILYAAVMAAPLSTRECQPRMHGAGSVEVVTALAAITAPDAHPSQIGLHWLRPDQLDGEWVHLVSSAADIDRIWPRIEASRPDFVKLILSYSEDYPRLRDDPTMPPWYRGLDPALVAPIVARAHRAGLKVAAHVMSGHDFEVAVDSGVDIVAHMPGFAPGQAFTPDDPPNPYLAALTPDSPRYLISPAAAARAARRRVVVVTTMATETVAPAAARNVATLRGAGVTLLIGSDRGELNSVDEAVGLVERHVMSAAEVVRSLAVTTPRYFFPRRRIGDFRAGSEATFVLLGANPLADIHALRSPRIVVQRGRQLRPETQPPAR